MRMNHQQFALYIKKLVELEQFKERNKNAIDAEFKEEGKSWELEDQENDV